MIEKSSVIAMSEDAGPYGCDRQFMTQNIQCTHLTELCTALTACNMSKMEKKTPL